jgi:Protein of unknown function (DUF5818)
MKKFTLAIVAACTFCVAAAVAQMAPGGASQGTQQSSPNMSSPRGQQQPGVGTPDQNAPMDQTSQSEQTGNTKTNENGEHKLKGCVQSQGGQYALETKKGKMIALTGQDVSAHVGHEVAVTGTWAKASNADMSQSSAGTAGEHTFNVTDVKMISDTCKMKGKSDTSGSSGTGTQGPASTGTQPPQ